MTRARRWSGRFAGTFYPELPLVLEDALSAWMDEEPVHAGRAYGVLVPHAGYVYSGRTAARAVARARALEVETVVVLAPSHRQPIEGIAQLDLEGFDTPLGALEVQAGWSELAGLRELGVRDVAPFAEHSLEVQLPMLQRAWPQARVVPLVFGRCRNEEAASLGQTIARAWTPTLRVLATSDLSHYHDRAVATALDSVFERELLSGDPVSLVRALEQHRTEACGVGPVLALMEMVRQLEGTFEVIERSDSAEASGEHERVVGYLSAVAVEGMADSTRDGRS